MNGYLIGAVAIILIIIIWMVLRPENFTMQPSSSWGFYTGTPFGSDFDGTSGYGLFGVWPSEIYGSPWKPWMWSRSPRDFMTPYTPVPQINYNAAPDQVSKPVSTYYIGLMGNGHGRPVISVNGFTGQTLQLDRNRPYFLAIHTPGVKFTITDAAGNDKIEPMEEGTTTVIFDNDDPKMLHYGVQGDTGSGGIIYLNNIKKLAQYSGLPEPQNLVGSSFNLENVGANFTPTGKQWTFPN